MLSADFQTLPGNSTSQGFEPIFPERSQVFPVSKWTGPPGAYKDFWPQADESRVIPGWRSRSSCTQFVFFFSKPLRGCVKEMITRNRPVAFRRKEMLLVATEAGNMCVYIYIMCIYIVYIYTYIITHHNSWHGQRKIVCNQKINSFEISKTTFPTFQKAFVVVDGRSWTPVYLLPANPRKTVSFHSDFIQNRSTPLIRILHTSTVWESNHGKFHIHSLFGVLN